MALNGKLRSWNDERGFGFIAPRDGGREIFVHISSFPRDGSRPTVGETIIYELGRGKDGKPQAVNAYRQALGHPSTYPRTRTKDHQGTHSFVTTLISLVLLVGIGIFSYSMYRQHFVRPQTSQADFAIQPPETLTSPNNYQCDGRLHCSQMTSCNEAKFFLKNCPGTKMDGNHDGIPCEQQWCTGSFSK